MTSERCVDHPWISTSQDPFGHSLSNRLPYKSRKRTSCVILPKWTVVAEALAFFFATSFAFALLWDVFPNIPVVVAFSGLAWGLFLAPSDLKRKTLLQPARLSDKLPEILTSLAVLQGLVAGLYVSEFQMSWFYSAALGRTYTNVLAQSPGGGYADAGDIVFASTAHVNAGMSTGYKSGDIYCAAPIMDTVNQTLQVAFWAVGINCCRSRSDFTCGSESRSDSIYGLRVPPDGLIAQYQSDFMQAVKQAAEVYDLIVDDEPVLLNLVSDAGKERLNMLESAGLILLVGSCAFVMLVFVVSISVMSIGVNTPWDEEVMSF